MSDDLLHLDATAQAEMVRTGQVSALELLEASIDAIERLDPVIGAVIHRRFDEARAEVRSGSIPAGPFHGVPMLVKDLGAHVAGSPTCGGTRFLRDHHWVAPHDSTTVARARAAGFVIVGKANTPELGLSPTTEPLAFGPTRNPWDPDRIVGGSSGGSAAAVAARMVAVAHASDGGGSIRNPAGACGLVGLKPTRGRTSLGPDIGDSWGACVTEGVVTRTVRDTAAALDALSGYASGDPSVAPPFTRPLVEEVGADPGRLRVGTFWTNETTPGGPDARDAVEACTRALTLLGHEVDEEHPDVLDGNELNTMLAVTVAASVARELDAMAEMVGEPVGADGVEPATWYFAEMGRAMSATAYLANQDALARYARRLTGWWDDGHDLLLTPTMAEPPPPIGSLAGADVERIVRLVPYTSPYNVSGQPAIALPVHRTPDGLPLGVQLVARHGREDLLVRVAAALEEALGWTAAMPPIHA